MKHLVAYLSLACIVAWSCEKKHTPHPILDFYPNTQVLEEGYVNKKYLHYYPKNANANAATQIHYTLYQKSGDSTFKTERYNAGFQLEYIREYAFDDETVRLLSDTRMSPEDTTQQEIIEATTANWKGKPYPPYQVKFTSQRDDKTYHYFEKQLDVYDSLVLEKPAKVFINEAWYVEVGKDSLLDKHQSLSCYVEDLGFFYSKKEYEKFTFVSELVEQMSIEKFRKLADHGEHRVGYIDPSNTLSDDRNFKLCSNEYRIADYYNDEPDAGYIDKKGELVRVVMEQVDSEKLKGQTGMMTFRFVINCEGEAGRFIVEQFDLDFQRTSFSKTSIDHLLEILLNLKGWQHLTIRDEPRDAYAYITFKLDNGKITDILP